MINICSIPILIIFIIDIIGLSLVIVFHKEISDLITKICKSFSKFITRNTGFFTILFLIIFFLEQALLIILVFHFFKVSSNLGIVISIFALIVVTTATLQKFIWEYKYQNLLPETISTTQENQMYLSDMKELIDENEKLIKENEELISKSKKSR